MARTKKSALKDFNDFYYKVNKETRPAVDITALSLIMGKFNVALTPKEATTDGKRKSGR